ncbi:hypothetical protein FKW77_009969 [Venturia effusa]|uniref:F-box domain-containing protein n=1 Tax=Venturia effusa TaxID=50376 RepID=A0A517L0B6_9PEZI|nr:hypothetical protein FKW77_009969 [Venturia effusa]
METATSQFLALADELLIEIISLIQDRQSLCALARTCSRLQDLTQDFIFHSPLIRNGDQARALAHLFSSGRIRSSAVHDLQIRWRHTVEDGIEDINSVLTSFTQLRNLRIESPCCNDGPWIEQPEKPAIPWTSGGRIDITGLFETALDRSGELSTPLLGQLQSLTLHSHGNGEGSARYELGTGAIIFLLPSLRYIMLSCYDIGLHEDLEAILSQNLKYANARKTTGLRTLIFEECNISFESFKTILKLPKALENLTVGERMYHTSASVMPMGFRPNFLEALSPQRSTLGYLKHMGGGRYWSQAYLLPHFQEDVSCLPALRTIELGPALGAKYTSQHLPPTLLTVRFLMTFPTDLGRENNFFDHPFWSASSSSTSSSSPSTTSTSTSSTTTTTDTPSHRIDVVFYRTPDTAFWDPPWRRDCVDRIAKRLQEQNTAFAIYQPRFCKRSLIPPYMYGEELPVEELVYVSCRRDVFGGRVYEGVGGADEDAGEGDGGWEGEMEVGGDEVDDGEGD